MLMILTKREKNLKAVVLEVLKVNDANDYEIVRVCQEILDEKT